MAKTLILGLDLGGTKTAAGVVDPSGRLLSSIRMPTAGSGVRQDLAVLLDAGRTAVAAAGVPWKAIRAVGVGVPGAIDPETQTVWAPNLPGWRRVPLPRLLKRVLRRPAFVEADRNVQALAEAWLGAGRGKRAPNLVFLTVGTGIGAGLIADGRLIGGSRGVAGAAGWLPISADWLPQFGRVGCLEARAAGPAVERSARSALRRKARSLLAPMARANRGKITAEMVALAARKGDRLARSVFAQVGADLGRGLAGVVSLLNPEIVVLGGGLAEAGELILPPLRRAARRWGHPLAARQVRIVRSRLGADAGVLGAARHALLMLRKNA